MQVIAFLFPSQEPWKAGQDNDLSQYECAWQSPNRLSTLKDLVCLGLPTVNWEIPEDVGVEPKEGGLWKVAQQVRDARHCILWSYNSR